MSGFHVYQAAAVRKENLYKVEVKLTETSIIWLGINEAFLHI